MNNKPVLERLMEGANGNDWSAIERLLPQAARSGVDPRLAAEEDRKKRQRLATAVYEIFKGTDGELVLEAILQKVHSQPTYYALIDIDPQRVAMFGAFREGQKSILDEILKLYTHGRDGLPDAKNTNKE